MIRIGMISNPQEELIKNAVLSIMNYSGLDINSLNIQPVDETNHSESYNIMLINNIMPCINLTKALDNIESGGILILNADEKNISGLRFTKPINVISYGFNPKSTVTASSVIEDEYLCVQCCIQREFFTLDGSVIEPQEFSINIKDNNATVSNILASVIVSLLCGASTRQIESLFLIAV